LANDALGGKSEAGLVSLAERQKKSRDDSRLSRLDSLRHET
jgi:hypothetical protein